MYCGIAFLTAWALVGNALRARKLMSSHPSQAVPAARSADFGKIIPQPILMLLANWVADSRDNQGEPFLLSTKNARVFVFDSTAALQSSSVVLLGVARGDDSVPGIGSRPIAKVKLFERTTPAGRFIAERGRNSLGEDVVWIDYDAAVSMHRVRLNNPKEYRLERLQSKSVEDNRISFGCINVPAKFYNDFNSPVFKTKRAVVYALPAVKSLNEAFPGYDLYNKKQSAKRLSQ